MKKFLCICVVLASLSFQLGHGSNSNNSENDQNPEITVIESVDDGNDFKHNKSTSLKFVYSLNLATKSKIKKMAIKELKNLAGSKGYSHIYIDESSLNNSHNEIRKRNYTVVIRGIAFKN